jgi:Flp pilus assembly pilin Flp
MSQPSSRTKEITPVLKYFFKASEAVKRLRMDKDGVVSFEYLIVAACVVASVSAMFGGAGAETIQGALTTGLAAITAAFTTAVGA